MKIWILALMMGLLASCGGDAGHKAPSEPNFWIDEDGNRHVLINGVKVGDDEKMFWPESRMFVSGSSCTGLVVGPKVFMTAAHCVRTGETLRFGTSLGPNKGQNYTAKATRSKLWGNTVHDIALAYMDRKFVGTPASVSLDRMEVNNIVTLSGFGCVRPGGGGGNDGILRQGDSKVTGRGKYDFITSNGGALCFGDSGGPVWFGGKAVGVNSRGNIKNTSYLTRLDIDETKQFFEDWSRANDAEICGFNAPADQCGGEVPPQPEKLVIENSILKVEIEMKEALKHSVDAVKGLFTMIMDYLEKAEPMNAPPVDLFLTNDEPITLPGPPL